MAMTEERRKERGRKKGENRERERESELMRRWQVLKGMNEGEWMGEKRKVWKGRRNSKGRGWTRRRNMNARVRG